ncbi:lonely Cys domain-containing protein, partial [Streptomyces sp. NPDC048663]|uniref:lonely Cys domain-containing protein n=1 Tax=Streptomyces sp. NPDC048663 TaxID=3155638 RepID=UPI0034343B85
QAVNMPPPYVDDPLEVVALGQHVANHSRMPVKAPTMSDGLGLDYIMLADAGDGTRGSFVTFRPEPEPVELAELVRVAGLRAGGGPVDGAVLGTMLRLVRALRQAFGVEIEDDRGVPGGRYERVLKGIGALETLRANDVALGRHTPFRMDLWTFYAGQLAQAQPGQAHLAVLDLARARLTAAPAAELGKELRHPSVDRVSHMFGTPAASEAFGRAVAGTPPTLPVGPNDVARAFWAILRAQHRLEGVPANEVEQLGRDVLHLPQSAAWDEARRSDLVRLIAKAVARGLNVGDPWVLGAYHLVLAGAFEPAASLGQATVEGFNWSGVPAPAGVRTDTVVEEIGGPAGAVAHVALRPPWQQPGQFEPFVIVTGSDASGVRVLHLPRLGGVRVGEREFLELLWMAQPLHEVPLQVPLLVLTSGPATLGPNVLQHLFVRTGRVNWSYSGLTELVADPSGGPLRIQ